MSTETYVSTLPGCDICKMRGQTAEAHYDGKTKDGPWAYMCEADYLVNGVGLGTGKGQRLIVGEKPKVDRAAAVHAAIAAGDLDALEDAVGDGDLAEYL